MKLVVTILLIGHIFACIWHGNEKNPNLIQGIAYYQRNVITWMDRLLIEDKDNYTKYIYAYYWATMTMTTVGYGGFLLIN